MKVGRSNFSYVVEAACLMILHLFAACGNPDVSIVIRGDHEGRVLIDSKSLSEFVKSKKGIENDTLFFLALSNGKHEFDIVVQESVHIRKTVFVQGEAYYAIDFETGELAGFDAHKEGNGEKHE